METSRNGLSHKVTVPQGVNGQSYLLFSECDNTVTDDCIAAGPTVLEVCHSMAMRS